MDGTGRAPGHDLQKEGGLDRCLQLRLGGTVRRQNGLRPLVKVGRLPSHQLPGNVGSMFGPSHLSARPEGTSGLSSIRLFILAECLLKWAQLNLRSLRGMHVSGKLNPGADMLSQSNVPSDEWTLHP